MSAKGVSTQAILQPTFIAKLSMHLGRLLSHPTCPCFPNLPLLSLTCPTCPYCPICPYFPNLPLLSLTCPTCPYFPLLSQLPLLSQPALTFPHFLQHTMSSRRDLLFENVCKELSNGCTIPLLYQITFEEALAITCQDFSHRQSRSDKGPQSNIKGRSRYFHKKANSVYLRILEYDPHIFIPFVLAFTPRACEKFDVSTFCQKHPKGSRLTTISKEDVVRIGNKLNIDEHPHFKILTSVLFTKGSPHHVSTN